jgi:hypothetical protein
MRIEQNSIRIPGPPASAIVGVAANGLLALQTKPELGNLRLTQEVVLGANRTIGRDFVVLYALSGRDRGNMESLHVREV